LSSLPCREEQTGAAATATSPWNPSSACRIPAIARDCGKYFPRKYFSSQNRGRQKIFSRQENICASGLPADFCRSPRRNGVAPVFFLKKSHAKSRAVIVHTKNDGKFANCVFNLFDGVRHDSH